MTGLDTLPGGRPQALDLRLAALLAEPLEAVRQREQDALEQGMGSLDADFLLFGAGNLGRKVLQRLQKNGKEPRAFIDNNAALWGTEVLGVPVMAPAEAARSFDTARIGVLVTIWYGEATDRMSDRLDPLRALGFRRIALFGHLAWRFREGFLPYYCLDRPSKVIEASERIRLAYAALSDPASRALFVDHVAWRLTLDYDLLPTASPEQIYFNPRFFNRVDDEVLYDVGAFTGDSIAGFLASARGAAFGQIHAFEPSAGNFGRLRSYVDSLQSKQGRVFAHHTALGNAVGTIQVQTDNGPSSRVGFGSETVALTTIDTLAPTLGAPTLIKIDIEGFEPDCLRGARAVIERTAPVVAASVYHLQDHLWEILLQLRDYRPDYDFHLCPHVADGWDLVLYAVPPHRRVNAPTLTLA
jgi:FkbM family methyltransferase